MALLHATNFMQRPTSPRGDRHGGFLERASRVRFGRWSKPQRDGRRLSRPSGFCEQHVDFGRCTVSKKRRQKRSTLLTHMQREHGREWTQASVERPRRDKCNRRGEREVSNVRSRLGRRWRCEKKEEIEKEKIRKGETSKLDFSTFTTPVHRKQCLWAYFSTITSQVFTHQWG